MLAIYLKYFDDFTSWLSGEWLLPFGLVVVLFWLCHVNVINVYLVTNLSSVVHICMALV